CKGYPPLHRVHERSNEGAPPIGAFDGSCMGRTARAFQVHLQPAADGPPAHGSLPLDVNEPTRRVPPMPHVATSPADLMTTIGGAAHLDGGRLVIDDEKAFRDGASRDLAWTAVFAEDDATKAAAQWLVWEASQELGA